MLKYQLKKEKFAALPADQKAMYSEAANGYQLKIEGMPDVCGLKLKVDELLAEKKTEEEKREVAEEEARRAAVEHARKKVMLKRWKRAGAKNLHPPKDSTKARLRD